jgi:hypothetical protein
LAVNIFRDRSNQTASSMCSKRSLYVKHPFVVRLGLFAHGSVITQRKETCISRVAKRISVHTEYEQALKRYIEYKVEYEACG